MHASKTQIKDWDRLRKRAEFLRVQNAGNKWVSKGLILMAAPAEAGTEAAGRYGITVTKRTSTSAVTRNRIKRRLRAVAADILPQYGRTGMDYVLIGRPETEKRLYADLQKDLKWCLKKLGYK